MYQLECGQKRMRIETMLLLSSTRNISVDFLLYRENEDARLRALVGMLKGQPTEFVDGVIMLVWICLEKFGGTPEA